MVNKFWEILFRLMRQCFDSVLTEDVLTRSVLTKNVLTRSLVFIILLK